MRTRPASKLLPLLAAFFLFCLWSVPAPAHELILVPQTWQHYSSGQKLPFAVASAHVFVKSAELEKPELVEAAYDGTPLKLTANQAFATYDGTAELKGPGCAILTAHRKGAIWSQTKHGVKEGGRKELKDVIEVRNYEKFCKTLLPVDGDSTGFDTVLGHPLEIVPLDDPFKAHAGDELRFRVLRDGRPCMGEVTGTYDGYSDQEDTWSFISGTDAHGVVRVRVHTPGMWLLRVQRVARPAKGADYDKHYLRSVLVFPVAP